MKIETKIETSVKCPKCGAVVWVEDRKKYQVLRCSSCGIGMEYVVDENSMFGRVI